MVFNQTFEEFTDRVVVITNNFLETNKTLQEKEDALVLNEES